MSAHTERSVEKSSDEEKGFKFAPFGIRISKRWWPVIAGFGIVAGAFFSSKLFLSAPASNF